MEHAWISHSTAMMETSAPSTLATLHKTLAFTSPKIATITTHALSINAIPLVLEVASRKTTLLTTAMISTLALWNIAIRHSDASIPIEHVTI